MTSWSQNTYYLLPKSNFLSFYVWILSLYQKIYFICAKLSTTGRWYTVQGRQFLWDFHKGKKKMRLLEITHPSIIHNWGNDIPQCNAFGCFNKQGKSLGSKEKTLYSFFKFCASLNTTLSNQSSLGLMSEPKSHLTSSLVTSIRQVSQRKIKSLRLVFIKPDSQTYFLIQCFYCSSSSIYWSLKLRGISLGQIYIENEVQVYSRKWALFWLHFIQGFWHKHSGSMDCWY